jgi:NhaD family Na+/H+ antiporter
MKKLPAISIVILSLLTPVKLAWCSASTPQQTLDLTTHIVGYLSIALFVIAYLLVFLEEKLHLHKSKPVLLAAGVIWLMIATVYQMHGIDHLTTQAIRHNFLEYSELFFFLLVAMTYINAMIERNVFDALRYWLVNKGFSYRALFWITGILAFFISPIADNLTTALIMCAVVMSVGINSPKFVAMSCINIVVAANAGGAFSPFGDITTLMVWQRGIIEFADFFKLFIPSVINFLVPALIMHYFVPNNKPDAVSTDKKTLIKRGGIFIVVLFLLTVTTAIGFHTFLHLPPVIGMLTGLAYLQLYGYYLRQTYQHEQVDFDHTPSGKDTSGPFNVFSHIAGSEWDTLFFFYGVIMSVGGLGFLGYLSLASEFIYGELGVTTANVLVGILSAIVDNIPVMFAILTMNPEMSDTQWLLVTLTAGVGGSLLSIGSAAGVALMGQARGSYTFFSHLKWSPAIAVGYAASIYAHLLING